MDEKRQKRFQEFLTWFDKHITGDEKGESQLFFDRLLQAFGNAGVKEAGATCEMRVKKRSGRTGFADLVWKPRVIVELKKRKEPLQKHYPQAFEYWLTLVPDRPEYMALSNFDEFWIYDLNQQLDDPVHKLSIRELPTQWGALAFLFPKPEKPVFDNHNIEVTEEVATIVGSLYLSLIQRKIEAKRAQRFVLQLVVALFSEDVGLIPQYTLFRILEAAVKNPVTQEKLEKLFKAMASEKRSDKSKEYANIPFFNGGLFDRVEPVELKFNELDLLCEASKQNWAKVRPSIFGSIFEGSMCQEDRHGHGIHYTSELDIKKIVIPTIVKPFREKINKAKNKKELRNILTEIENFKVLDPACGSGNFLYVAFRELRRLEMEVMEKIDKNFNPKQLRFNVISPKNFFGIDTNPFGLELAKIALSIGRKLSADEFGIVDTVLPFDNLDEHFICEDALFVDWPESDAIIGNPPYLSSKFMKVEYPVEYVNRVRDQFKDVPGRADYCVYWFRKAHDHLKDGQRAGLVGTNTIRQNYSRIGGLDYIVNNGGLITEAVSTQVWSGDANVHVSIVNWLKGNERGKKRLFIQRGDRVDSPWDIVEMPKIASSLSANIDVGLATDIETNKKPKRCFVGQAPQSEGFYLSEDEYRKLLSKDDRNRNVLFPFLIGRDLLSKERRPKRYIIDFGQRTIIEAKSYSAPFQRVEQLVLPDVQCKADNEIKKSGKKGGWSNHLQRWWQHWRSRPDLFEALDGLKRYIVVSRVTKRPIFEFCSTEIHPGDALVAFSFDDDYSFGVLQSAFHWEWFRDRCSTLKGDWRYTGDTVFESFPWPQSPTKKSVEEVALAAQALRCLRNDLMRDNGFGLKDLYKSLDLPGKNPLKESHMNLDQCVGEAYGFKKNSDRLKFIFDLNQNLVQLEKQGKKINGPGYPRDFKNKETLWSDDCISLETVKGKKVDVQQVTI